MCVCVSLLPRAHTRAHTHTHTHARDHRLLSVARTCTQAAPHTTRIQVAGLPHKHTQRKNIHTPHVLHTQTHTTGCCGLKNYMQYALHAHHTPHACRWLLVYHTSTHTQHTQHTTHNAHTQYTQYTQHTHSTHHTHHRTRTPLYTHHCLHIPQHIHVHSFFYILDRSTPSPTRALDTYRHIPQHIRMHLNTVCCVCVCAGECVGYDAEKKLYKPHQVTLCVVGVVCVWVVCMCHIHAHVTHARTIMRSHTLSLPLQQHVCVFIETLQCAQQTLILYQRGVCVCVCALRLRSV